MRFSLLLFVVIAIAVESPASNVAQPAPNGTESLGAQLLDDLSPGGQRPVAPRQTEHESKMAHDEQQGATSPPQGFGVGSNAASQPLIRVQRGMQSAEALLVQPGAADGVRVAGTVQQKVLSELDELIAQLSKQCQCQGQCNGGQCNGDKPCDKPGQKPGKPGAAKGSGKSAAHDSTDRLDRTTATPVDKGEVDEIVKSLWGQLPQRSREQMRQSFSDEFLPKYEIEIEQYYRRLSEEQGEVGAK